MLKEVFDAISKQARKAAGPRKVPRERERRSETFVIDGDVTEFPVPPPIRNHQVGSLEAFAQLTLRGAEPSVWHKDNQVVGVLVDNVDSDLADRVTWKLTASEKYGALAGVAREPRDQPSFVRFIEKFFRDEIEAAAPGLLGDLRALKFRTIDDQTGNVQRGRESMGREIDAEMTGADKLPDLITMSVPRWAELTIRCSIKCRLNVMATERKLSLEPLGDEINAAEILAHAALDEAIHQALTDEGGEDVDVFHGIP